MCVLAKIRKGKVGGEGGEGGEEIDGGRWGGERWWKVGRRGRRKGNIAFIISIIKETQKKYKETQEKCINEGRIFFYNQFFTSAVLTDLSPLADRQTATTRPRYQNTSTKKESMVGDCNSTWREITTIPKEICFKNWRLKLKYICTC